jgi:hypothetical protein
MRSNFFTFLIEDYPAASCGEYARYFGSKRYPFYPPSSAALNIITVCQINNEFVETFSRKIRQRPQLVKNQKPHVSLREVGFVCFNPWQPLYFG